MGELTLFVMLPNILNFVYYMYIVNNLLKLTVIYIPSVNTYQP